MAAYTLAVKAVREIQLLPAGQFHGIDGRPIDVPHWLIDATFAAQIIDEFKNRINRTVVDYEHQTLLSIKL